MVSVSVEARVDDDELGGVWLEGETWMLNVWATTPDFRRLAGVEDTDWHRRRVLQVGACAHARVWWSERDGLVSIMVGEDSEAYDLLVTVPLSTVQDIVTDVERQVPSPRPCDQRSEIIDQDPLPGMNLQ